jgi:hypothetical protein
MPNLIKTKLLFIGVFALIIAFIAPAKADAPHKEDINVTLLAYDDPKAYAKLLLDEQNLSEIEYKCLVQLWDKESHWNYKADNPKSTAYGIAQMLNEDSKHPAEQISNGLRYIKHRYDTPCEAWKFWRSHYWY